MLAATRGLVSKATTGCKGPPAQPVDGRRAHGGKPDIGIMVRSHGERASDNLSSDNGSWNEIRDA